MKTSFSPTTKKLLAFIAIILVIGMFLVRGILLNNGTIDRIMTLDPEAMAARLRGDEMTITSGSQTGMATAIDSFKSSTKDETYQTYCVTANHLIEDPANFSATLLDGSTYEAILIATDVSEDLAIFRIDTEDEIETPYDRDALGRVQPGDTVWYLGTDGELVEGTYHSTEAISGDWEEALAGGGVYDVSGYYVGMLVQENPNTIRILLGNTVHNAVKAAE